MLTSTSTKVRLAPGKKARASEEAPRLAIETARGVKCTLGTGKEKINGHLLYIPSPNELGVPARPDPQPSAPHGQCGRPQRPDLVSGRTRGHKHLRPPGRRSGVRGEFHGLPHELQVANGRAGNRARPVPRAPDQNRDRGFRRQDGDPGRGPGSLGASLRDLPSGRITAIDLNTGAHFRWIPNGGTPRSRDATSPRPATSTTPRCWSPPTCCNR